MLPDWLELVITDDKATQIGLASLTGIALILFCLVHIPLGFRLLRAVLAGRKLRSAASLDSGAESSDADAKRREAVSRALDGTIFEPNLKSFLRGWNDSKNDYHQSPMRFASTFLENPLIPPGARRTLLGSIPGIFLAFGILGTFFGLTLALSQVQELAQDDTDGRINLLTASLSLAFRTSLLGIVFSVIFVLFARLIEGRAEYHEHSIDGFVHKFYPWLSPDEVSALSLKEQIRSTGTIATALESVSADLQNVLADGLQEIRDSASSTSSVVSEELVNTLSKTLNEGVAAHVSELSSAIAATTESQQSLGLLLQSANEAFQASNDAQQAIHSMLQDTAASVEKASTEITLAGNLFGPATSELSSASSSIKSTSEILSEGFTVFGRYGCFFTEGLIGICETLRQKGNTITYNLINLHETPYENKILDLKGAMPDSEVQLHEVSNAPNL